MMELKSNLATFVTLLFLLTSVKSQLIFDIIEHGAQPDTDITEILKNVWNEACGSLDSSKVLVPQGNYILSEAKLIGPCKSPIEVNVEGTLKAHAEPMGETMIMFRYVDQLTVSGNGVFDGHGEIGWNKNDCHKNKKCAQLPMNMKFSFVTNSIVKDITSLDSKNFQINIHGCKNLTFQHVNVIAPDQSPNTDGIHIGSSEEIYIIDTKIATGDDCVSIGDKINQLYITNVTCGPGHGISLGSLGRNTKEKEVKGIFVKQCKIIGTDNGVRIKTWPNSPVPVQVSDIHFEDIEMDNVRYPIVIDQEYCPYDQCNKEVPSKVQISNVSFTNIRGTSADPVAVKIICSKSYPCTDVKFENIDLTYNGTLGAITSQCLNMDPIVSGTQNPPICAEPAPSVMIST